MFAKPDCMAACLILKPVTSVGCKMCQNNVLLQSRYIFSNLLMQCVTVLNSLITVQFQVLQSLKCYKGSSVACMLGKSKRRKWKKHVFFFFLCICCYHLILVCVLGGGKRWSGLQLLGSGDKDITFVLLHERTRVPWWNVGCVQYTSQHPLTVC